MANNTQNRPLCSLWRLMADDAQTGNTPFVDIPAGEYYTEPVRWAVKNEITNGTDETHFSPDLPCTRAQIVTFLWRAMK